VLIGAIGLVIGLATYGYKVGASAFGYQEAAAVWHPEKLTIGYFLFLLIQVLGCCCVAHAEHILAWFSTTFSIG
jgi:hypothetical protein